MGNQFKIEKSIVIFIDEETLMKDEITEENAEDEDEGI